MSHFTVDNKMYAHLQNEYKKFDSIKVKMQ
jgi:hypothetical protein